MKKLYEKNELLFAILAIVVYVAAMGTIRGNFGDDSPVALAALAALAALLTAFILKNGLKEKYGLRKPVNARGLLYFIPFGLLCTVNLWGGVRLHFGPAGQIIAAVNMALVGLAEELIFRGLLFKAIAKENVRRAAVISAVTFGAGHIVNLLTGHGSAETILQIVYAAAIGLSFVLVFHKGKSLIPCIVTHAAIDVGSVFSGDLPETAAALFILAVAGLYSVYLLKTGALRPGGRNR